MNDLTELINREEIIFYNVQDGFSTQPRSIHPYLVLHPTHVAAIEGTKSFKSKVCQLTLFGQPLDKTAVIQLFDQTHINEVFGAGGARFGVLFTELGESFFDRVE